MNNFNALNLHPNISKAVAATGYVKPTPVQAQSIPEILQGKDVIVSAQTGTGKTAAFVLPALHLLSSQKPAKKPSILVLTPTRELASQITKAASTYGKFLQFKIISLLGGMPYHHQIKDLARGADIIVATPGRLIDHMENGRVDLSEIKMLVLDEADRMLDMGFTEDVQFIAKKAPTNRQTLLFSATVDKNLINSVRHLLKNPVRIDLSDQKITSPQIKQELYKANNTQHKSRLLKHFLNDENIYKAIIFSATKVNADKLAYELRDEGFAAAALHGDLKQNVRNRTIEQLRRGKIQFLVATDVAARGIDISDITHVINYDLPKFCEDYVHRIGRTGRAGKNGVAISFVLPTDIRHVQRIERYIGQRLKLVNHVELNDSVMPKNDKHSFSHEIDERPKKKFSSSDEGHAGAKHNDRPRRKPSFNDERSSSNERGGYFNEKSGNRPKKKFSPKNERSSSRDHHHEDEKKNSYAKKKPSFKNDRWENNGPKKSEKNASGSFKHRSANKGKRMNERSAKSK